ncbi:MAG: glycosyltransferase family 4 protein [Desulfobacterales bacterium]|nr:glycosyltransferase family 4 protein [Desulfobacterales bacterium]MBF0397264.1 glycosyltransferase family 4 protein [Desulfobacterales bacterium]
MQHIESPLKICLMSYRSNPHCGGQGVYIQHLSRALKALGHHVEVISGPPYPVLDKDIPLICLPSLDLYNPNDLFRVPKLSELSNATNLIEWLKVSTMGFPEPYTFGLRAYKFLKNKANKYDIIHDNQSLSYGLWGIKRYIPTTVTIHHPITVDRRIDLNAETVFWKKIKHFRWYSFINMQKRVARTFSHIITVSKKAREDIVKEFGIPIERFRVVENGIDTDIFYPIPEIPREKNRIIVTNSADIPLKGLSYLLKAVYKLSKDRKIKLIVIGTPKENGSIVKLIRKLGIGDVVKFTGRVDNKEFVRQYAKASVAVVPSVYEGFGFPAGEAMACAVPVVATMAGALPEVVGDAGILVPPADWEAIYKSIVEVLDNFELAQKLGEAGYNRVQNNFTWKRAAEKTVFAYRETINAYH